MKDDPKKAFEIMLKSMAEMGANEMSPMVSDFRQIMHDYWPIFSAQWSGEIEMIPWKWPTMQDQSKGLRAGDLISLVGRPGLGKTWLLLAAALHSWRTTGKPVLFVSMEMMREVIMERLAAIYASVPMNFFKDGVVEEGNLFGAGGKAGVKKKIAQAEKEPSPFWVVDGNMTSTVDDVVAFCQQYGVVACFIDGGYMLGNKEHMGIYERVATNTNLLKQKVATKLRIPCGVSWQFAKEATKLKQGQIPGLEHIGYSDVIPQASSVVAALFQTDDSGNAELLNKRQVHILKGRGGETGSFMVDWNFNTCAFDEFVLAKGDGKTPLTIY
jgi:replicative DNA helicase